MPDIIKYSNLISDSNIFWRYLVANANLTIDLKARKDKDGRVFYVGKLDAPVLIDCSKGVAFLVFISDKGEEVLQISKMDKNDQDI